MHQGFPAFYDKNSKILILGSFPSVKSRENGFYYGNRQNRFWKMLSQIFEEEISNDIESKKQFLCKHHIALYDVVEESNLSGSADLNLEKSQHKIADISFLLPPNTKVEKILCNGKTSFNLLAQSFLSKQQIKQNTPLIISNIPVICLPSTSPANPRFTLPAWQQHLKFLK